MNNKEIRKPQKNSYFLKTFFLALITALIIAIIFTVAYAILYTPDIDDEVPFETGTSNSDETSTSDQESDTEVSNTDPEDLRVEGKYNFLVIGRDNVGLNTDVMMLVSMDTTAGSLAIMQIPRDTYINVDGTPHKINSVFATLVNDAYRNDSEQPYVDGMEAFVDILQKSFSVKIDYYALLNLKGFRNIIDIIGGVNIYIPANMYYQDPDQDLYIDLVAGQHILDGRQSENFIRFREGYITGDIGRIDAQKIFISALMESVKNNISLSNVLPLISEIFDNLTTNMPVKDMGFFAQQALGMDLSNAVMMTMPGESIREYGSYGLWYYVAHRNELIEIINTYFNMYTFEITDDFFDADRKLNDDSNSYFNEIYYAELSEDGSLSEIIHSADDINQDGLYIPRY